MVKEESGDGKSGEEQSSDGERESGDGKSGEEQSSDGEWESGRQETEGTDDLLEGNADVEVTADTEEELLGELLESSTPKGE